MSRRIPILATSLLLAATAMAVPAKRVKHLATQPDGKTLVVTLRGDENFHYVSSLDGKPLVKRADGAYCYAALATDGHTLVSSDVVAHNVDDRSDEELAYLETNTQQMATIRSLGAKRAAQRNARRVEKLAKRNMASMSNLASAPKRQQMAGATGGEGIGVTGKRKGLVILVNFKDQKMQASHTRQEFDNFFNQEGYNKMGNSGSVHDYFYNQSYGLFDLTFDVVGPVTVSKNMADYGANDSSGDDIDPAGMVYEACQLAYNEYKMDMSQYDWDGDGAVDQVYIVYAGYGEASGASDDCIWQHEWDISAGGYSLVLGGKRIRTYGCSSELNGSEGTVMDGIGTACHEFSHCLGIPDLYDTAGNGYYGMDEWDLMDYGSYAGDGYKPVGYNTYEKWVSGWIQPKVLNTPCYVNDLKPLSEEPEACVVFNEKTPTEYYILENRQLLGNDTELPAHGMLVIHVDYNQKDWQNNVLNNDESHQRFTIVPADNKLSSYTNSADTYPGTTGNNQLTDTSRPAATLFNANTDGRKYLGKPITDIYENKSGNISFTFMNGEIIDVPQGLTTSAFNASGFTASWSAVEDAESYNVELREKSTSALPDECLYIAEDLTGWGSGYKGDGTTDISSELDDLMSTKGWTGSKVFVGVGGAKLGSSKGLGNLTSPLLTAEGTNVTMRLQAKPYGNDPATITLALTDENDVAIASKDVTIDGTMLTVVLPNNDEKNFHLSITPKKRCYVQSIGIYNGNFDDADFETAEVAQPTQASMVDAPLRASQKFTDVKSTSYAFTGLKTDGIYQWRVQAIKGNATSDWTAWQTVDMSSQTSVKGISTEDVMSAFTMVSVYTLSGIHLGNMTYAEFCSNTTLHGVFVLQYDGGAMRVVK